MKRGAHQLFMVTQPVHQSMPNRGRLYYPGVPENFV